MALDDISLKDIINLKLTDAFKVGNQVKVRLRKGVRVLTDISVLYLLEAIGNRDLTLNQHIILSKFHTKISQRSVRRLIDGLLGGAGISPHFVTTRIRQCGRKSCFQDVFKQRLSNGIIAYHSYQLVSGPDNLVC